MGVIRVTTRPGYYAAMEAEEAIREPEVQEDIAVYVSKTLASRIQAYIKNGR